MRRNRLLRGFQMIAIVALGVVVFGFLVERLWNWLVPAVFGWRSISFVQALGLLVLSKILFGGLHRHGRGGGWRRGMRDRWAGMSAEEREQFRAGLRGSRVCGWDRVQGARQEETAR